MNLRTTISSIYNITAEEVYHIYVVIRDLAKGALWLRNRWRTLSAFDKWTMRVAGGHTMIGAMPGVLLGVLVALAISGPIPLYTNPYYSDWQLAVAVITVTIAASYYATVGRFLLDRLKGPLRLKQPSEVIDQIIKRRA